MTSHSSTFPSRLWCPSSFRSDPVLYCLNTCSLLDVFPQNILVSRHQPLERFVGNISILSYNKTSWIRNTILLFLLPAASVVFSPMVSNVLPWSEDCVINLLLLVAVAPATHRRIGNKDFCINDNHHALNSSTMTRSHWDDSKKTKDRKDKKKRISLGSYWNTTHHPPNFNVKYPQL